MIPDTALWDGLFSDLDAEPAATRRVLERVPDELLGWRPHEKSWTFGELATHLAGLPRFPAAILATEGLDLATLPPPEAGLPNREALLERWDRHAAAFREAVEATDDSALAAPWTLRKGDHVIAEAPRHRNARTWGLSHMAHPRGQLTVYLRLLDAPVPGVYGPTADER